MVRIALVVCAVTGLVAGSARAEERAEGVVRLDVAVGETIDQDVGFAIGLRCDDLAIIHMELRASTSSANTFSVTGVQQGTTMCRVGTVPSWPTYLFEIHVVAPRRPSGARSIGPCEAGQDEPNDSEASDVRGDRIKYGRLAASC